MAKKLLFITVGNNNEQDIDITHGSRSIIDNQSKRDWEITKKIFEATHFKNLPQQEIENIFILGHGTEVGIGDDTPKAFAKKFAQKFDKVQKEQVKHLYVYACGFGQVINNNCKASQLASELYQQGFKNITVHTIISPPDIEPGARMVSAIYSRMGIFGDGLAVGGGYSFWNKAADTIIFEKNSLDITRLTEQNKALTKNFQSPKTNNKVETQDKMIECRKQISHLTKENNKIQSKAIYFTKNNDLIAEMNGEHNQFSKSKPLTDNIQKAADYYSKATNIKLSEDALNKQYAIESIKQRITELTGKIEKLNNKKGKYTIYNNTVRTNANKNKSDRVKLLEKLLEKIEKNIEWKRDIRVASKNKIFNNIMLKLVRKEKTKQLLEDISNDRYSVEAMQAVNAELNPDNSGTTSRKNLTSQVKINEAQKKKSKINNKGGKNTAESEMPKSNSKSINDAEATDLFPDSDNESKQLITGNKSIKKEKNTLSNKQVNMWLQNLKLNTYANNKQNIHQKKLDQLDYFSKQLKKANFSIEQLIYLSEALHEFQLTGAKTSVGDNFDLIRTERNRLRYFDANYGNTSSWQKICRDVKNTLIEKLTETHAEKNSFDKKTSLPADIYQDAERVLRQRTGRFLSRSHLFKTTSSVEFYSRFTQEEQATRYTKKK